MGKVKKFLDSDAYLSAIALIMMVFWLGSYLSNKQVISASYITQFENIQFMIIAFAVFLLLVFFKNTAYIAPIIIFVPFIFARAFDVYTAPTCIYVSLGLLVIGFIVNFVRFRPKLRIGIFGPGFALLGLAMILGGINTGAEYVGMQILFISICVVSFALIYVYLSSSVVINFRAVARIMTYLGVFLTFQLFVYFILQDDLLAVIFDKLSNVGWGISNNIALMLLLTFPFTLYLAINEKRLRCILYIFLTVLQLFAIVLTYSRGAAIAMGVGIVFLVPISIWKAKDKKAFIICAFAILVSLVVGFLWLYKQHNEYYDKFIDIIFRIDWSTLNGRVSIYAETIDALKESPIFGRGVFALFERSDGGKYTWGHSTVIQTAQTMGILGLGALGFHLVEKYYYFFRNIKLWKVIVIFGLGLSDLYGMFDISYYFINYMVVLILVLAMSNNLIIREKVQNIKGENDVV